MINKKSKVTKSQKSPKVKSHKRQNSLKVKSYQSQKSKVKIIIITNLIWLWHNSNLMFTVSSIVGQALFHWAVLKVWQMFDESVSSFKWNLASFFHCMDSRVGFLTDGLWISFCILTLLEEATSSQKSNFSYLTTGLHLKG